MLYLNQTTNIRKDVFTLRPQEVNNNNILSEEQQKQFNKLLSEYEEREKIIDNANSDEGLVKNAMNSRKLVLSAVVICAALCVGGLFMSFDGITQQENNSIQAAADAKKAQEAEQAQKQKEKQEASAAAAEEAERKAQEKKELDEIKKGFKPFEQHEVAPVQSNPTPVTDPAVTTPTVPNYRPDTTPTGIHAKQAPNANNPAVAPAEVPVEQQGAWMELKGIAQGKNGKIAYIANGSTTGTYGIGDTVGNYVVQSIDSTTVVVIDKETGYPLYLNK